MTDSDTYAERKVAGWELYLRKAPSEDRWHVSLCDRIMNAPTALMDRELRIATLPGQYFEGKTFATPDEAADYLRQIVC